MLDTSESRPLNCKGFLEAIMNENVNTLADFLLIIDGKFWLYLRN